ncbi:hypothetical protein [Gimesia sp.]|uniref:hypothetical protein n=1 Tax=Gimesia sp. TaxID=2024833 RepID=UPI003A8EF32C
MNLSSGISGTRFWHQLRATVVGTAELVTTKPSSRSTNWQNAAERNGGYTALCVWQPSVWRCRYSGYYQFVGERDRVKPTRRRNTGSPQQRKHQLI